MKWTSLCDIEGLLCFFVRARATPVKIDVDKLGIDNFDLDKTGREHLLELATTLENLDESRAAADRQLLAQLIAKYEATYGEVRSVVPLTIDLPDVDPVSPTGEVYASFPLPDSDSRPILDGTTPSMLLQHLRDSPQEPLHPHFLARLLELTRRLHLQRSEAFGPVMRLSVLGSRASGDVEVARVATAIADPSIGSPSPRRDHRVVILGDTHGQLTDLLWIFATLGLPSDKNVYVVNGDLVDRWIFGAELCALLFTLMLQHPAENVVVVNRGNHECMTMNGSRCGGFKKELLEKYGPSWGPYLHEVFGSVFALLPVATVIDESILVVHGGIGQNPEEQFQLLQELTFEQREPTLNMWNIDGDPHIDAMVDAVWSDPGDDFGSEVSSRGTAHVWGPDYTEKFLQATGFKLIVRSHEVPADRKGVFVHDSHGGRVVTVFSASNYGSRMNSAGAVLVYGHGSVIEPIALDMGLCPSHECVQDLPLLDGALGSSSVGRAILHSRSLSRFQERSDYNKDLLEELLQQIMGLLVEFRSALWDACTSEDQALAGAVGHRTWSRVCANVTRIRGVDWVLVAKLVGGATKNHVRYMDTLNRFGFKIESQVVANDVAEAVLTRIFLSMMRADASLQQLLGSLCKADETLPVREMHKRFSAFLARHGVVGIEMDAVLRSLETQMNMQSEVRVSIADFLSTWIRASAVQTDLDLTFSQQELVSRISRLFVAPRGRTRAGRLERANSFVTASGSVLMEFFRSADTSGTGYLPIDAAEKALAQMVRDATTADEAEELLPGLRDILLVADATGDGNLNYLEFLRLFDHQDPQRLTHQSVLDALCFQVWVHRNALSGLFRYIGSNGRVSKDQIRWGLEALNSANDGQLLEANIMSIVNAVNFTDGTVSAEEFLHSFELVDSHRKVERLSHG